MKSSNASLHIVTTKTKSCTDNKEEYITVTEQMTVKPHTDEQFFLDNFLDNFIFSCVQRTIFP